MACLTPFYIDVKDKKDRVINHILVPCGKCEDCLKKKQSDWISRLMVESQMSLRSFFITLTYDENHLPFPEGVNKKDVQLFFKRFRKKLTKEQKFTYLTVSEYGTISSRPHYHLLLFCRFNIDYIALSYILEESWKLGQHKIGSVDISCITYCSKYCLKSRRDVRHIYDNKTFMLVSKRPALGFDLLQIKDQFKDQNCFEVVSGDRVVAMPRYYRDKIFNKFQRKAHALEIQEKYCNKPGAISAYDRLIKRISFERKQQNL